MISSGGPSWRPWMLWVLGIVGALILALAQEAVRKMVFPLVEPHLWAFLRWIGVGVG